MKTINTYYESYTSLEQFVISNYDTLFANNNRVLKALTNLVNTVTGELQEANEKLQFTSFHDSLTGLYNRRFFEQEMSRLETCNTSVGMIMCDVDDLKLVNDALGHDLGDATLKAVANILKSLFIADEMVARIGGRRVCSNPSWEFAIDTGKFLRDDS